MFGRVQCNSIGMGENPAYLLEDEPSNLPVPLALRPDDEDVTTRNQSGPRHVGRINAREWGISYPRFAPVDDIASISFLSSGFHT